MTKVRATCLECGDVEFNIGENYIALFVRIGSEAIGGTSIEGVNAVYTFLCPKKEHSELVTKEADAKVTRLLIDSGVVCHVLTELDDTDRDKKGRELGSITPNEVSDVVIDLNTAEDPIDFI